jgi:hypothetical protein
MRNLLFVLVLLVGGVAALGFYRGWFTFERTSDPADGRAGARLEVDRNKIQPDIEKVKEKVGGAAHAGEKSEGK